MQIATQQFQSRGTIPGVGQLEAQKNWITMADLFNYIYYMKLGAQMQNVYLWISHPEMILYRWR